MGTNEIKTIYTLTDDFIKENFKIKHEIVEESATFINLETPVTIILPKRFCYGCTYYKNDDVNKKPSLSYSINILKNEDPAILEEDRLMHAVFEKITKQLTEEMKNSTVPKIKHFYSSITKDAPFLLKGFKSIEHPKDPSKSTPGKYGINLTLNKDKLNIINGQQAKIHYDNIIVKPPKGGEKVIYKSGEYLNVIKIVGMVFVSKRPCLSMQWIKCQYIKSTNQHAIKIDKEWMSLAEKLPEEKLPEIVEGISEINIDETPDVTQTDIDNYENSMKEEFE